MCRSVVLDENGSTAGLHGDGGAGTMAAGPRAGVPSIVVPFTVDQPFWGSRVVSLGVGPTPIPQRRLTSAGLAAALGESMADTAVLRRASELGARIREEDGLAAAIDVYERALGSRAASAK